MFTLCLYTDSALIHSVSFQQQTFPSSPNGFHRISRYFQPPKSVQEQIGFEHLSRSSVMTVQNFLLMFFTNSLIILILFDFHCIIFYHLVRFPNFHIFDLDVFGLRRWCQRKDAPRTIQNSARKSIGDIPRTSTNKWTIRHTVLCILGCFEMFGRAENLVTCDWLIHWSQHHPPIHEDHNHPISCWDPDLSWSRSFFAVMALGFNKENSVKEKKTPKDENTTKTWILSISAWCFHHHSFNEVLGFTWEPMVRQIQLRSFSTAWKDHSARLCSLCSWFSCVTRRSLTISQLQTNVGRLRCISCSPSRKSSCRFCILSCSCPSEKGNHLHRKAPCNHLDSLRSAPAIEGQKPGEDLKDLSDV